MPSDMDFSLFLSVLLHCEANRAEAVNRYFLLAVKHMENADISMSLLGLCPYVPFSGLGYGFP